MQIKWYGHSCFLLTDSNGVRILTDPCDEATGYSLHGIETDAVTVSHDHHDHNYTAAAAGNPQIIKSCGEFALKGVKITGIPSFHDKQGGALRGENIMYIFEMDDMRILHCGDLGQLPDEATLARLHDIDILLVPIGGIYTIDDLEARELANLIRPKVVIPMHYKTPQLKFDVMGLAPFIDAAKDCRIHKLNDCEASISRMSLGDDRVIVLTPCTETI